MSWMGSMMSVKCETTKSVKVRRPGMARLMKANVTVSAVSEWKRPLMMQLKAMLTVRMGSNDPSSIDPELDCG